MKEYIIAINRDPKETIPREYFDNLFKTNKNWKNTTNTKNTDFFFTINDKNYYDTINQIGIYFNDKIHKNYLTNKSNLFHFLKKEASDIYEKYMVYHTDIYIDNIDKYKDLFDGKKRYILRPTWEFARRGIKIFNNFDKFKDYMTYITKKNSHRQNIELNKYVLSEFIENQLLFKNRYFNFRVFFIVSLINGIYRAYTIQPFIIHPAEKEISNSNSYDLESNISSSELTNDMTELEEEIGKQKTMILINQMKDIMGQILNLIKKNKILENYENNKNTYEIFGIDFISDSDLKIKLIEFNHKPGLNEYTDDTYKKLVHTIIDSTINKLYEKKYRIKINKKYIDRIHSYKKFTYLIKSEYFPEKFIDKIFRKRGNWHKVTDDELQNYEQIDFIYLDGLNYLKKEYFSLKSNLKNNVDDNKRSIGYKNNLMKNLEKIPEASKFLMKQYEIDLLNVNNDKEYLQYINNLFEKNKIYIFKPVTGMAGSDIKVFENFNDCEKYINEIIEKYSKMWKNKEPIKQKNRLWVLQEYIQNPLLITKNNEKYKFHIRHFFIYQPDPHPKYYKKIGKVALAEKPYINGNWDDPKIHDTHFHSFDKYLFTTEDTNISDNQIENINSQIDEFYKILIKIIDAKCYSETKNCLELSGIDFMITDKLELKILEINFGIGLGQNLIQNKKELFEGIIDLIVDDYFPPLRKHKNKSLDLFIKM
jgi:hypothetical protein